MTERAPNRVVAAGRWFTPWLGGVNLTLALTAHFTGTTVGWLLFSMAAATVLASLIFALGYLFSPEGLRSGDQLGFDDNRGFIRFSAGPEGTRTGVHVLAAASALVAVITGWVDTPAGILALSTFLLAISWTVITTRWPADELD